MVFAKSVKVIVTSTDTANPTVGYRAHKSNYLSTMVLTNFGADPEVISIYVHGGSEAITDVHTLVKDLPLAVGESFLWETQNVYYLNHADVVSFVATTGGLVTVHISVGA